MKKLITLIMALTLVLSCVFSSFAFAAQPENIEPYASSYFTSNTVKLSDEGNGKVKVTYTVASKDVMDELGIKKIVIQKKVGSDWDDVKTYSSANYSSFISQNVAEKRGSITYNGTEGKTYQAKVTFYAKDSSGSATKTITSSITV